jgi:acetyltransferase-like isoleucine patch superfamily enzyme
VKAAARALIAPDAPPGFPYPPHLRTTPPDDIVVMGEQSYSRPHVEWYVGDTGRIHIGKWCSIHPTVRMFSGGEHNPDWVTTFAIRARLHLPGGFEDGQPRTRGDITVGNDVYFCMDAVVLSGVTIGDGAIIGARAVVTDDVPPYAIVGGVPARVVRRRFGEEEIEALLRVRWWDWPTEQVIDNVALMSQPDIGAFLRVHDARYAAEHPE